jgi:hypothetical protein
MVHIKCAKNIFKGTPEILPVCKISQLKHCTNNCVKIFLEEHHLQNKYPNRILPGTKYPSRIVPGTEITIGFF